MKKLYLYLAVVGVVLFAGLWAAIALPVLGQSMSNNFDARLDGFQETPAVSTTGSGSFNAKTSVDDTEITYELTYSGLEGPTTTAAHIHLGRPGVAGGVIAFLCGGGGKPACPATSGTVSGTIVAADVIGPVAQGISPGEFAELLRALREGATYANVHTNLFPGGEIRGEIR
ncbi:MAG TPA: CHRD domain-containing protein [Thermoleophilia bacterium]|nr:CHRD domain-containing protein [Thermoleophilia bacterium]